MPFRTFQRLPLHVKLISSYLVILATGGLLVTIIGSLIVSTAIMNEARRTLRHDLAIARTIYEQQLRVLRRTVELGTAGITIPTLLEEGDTAGIASYLERSRAEGDLDFLTLTDAAGRVIARPEGVRAVTEVAAVPQVVRAALAGNVSAGTEVLARDQLAREDPALVDRARLPVLQSEDAGPVATEELSAGLTMVAGAPVHDGDGRLIGVLYGGVLLNRNDHVVDEVWDRLYRHEQRVEGVPGTVTIFLRDVRVATNVRTADGVRAVGTRVSRPVREQVLERGESYSGRAFVVNDWFVTAYEPIHDFAGEVVGMLYVGLQEGIYTAARNRVIYSFVAIETVAFALITGITFLMIKSMTNPIGKMVAATRRIAAGNLATPVDVDPRAEGEMAVLARSFNSMLEGLRRMRADLEEWAGTLEQRVQERTEELGWMQVRVAQSERLASIGMLAAGVAHEINNPLGGVLALTSLTLEDLPPDHPNRPNLEEVVRQSERCRDIVKHLLEFSRQSAAHTESVDVNLLIEKTLALLGNQSLFFNIRLEKDLDPALPRVLADRSQLQQVLMNIVLNAVQAMDERGTLAIVTRRDDASGDLEILVRDTGHGIAPEDLHRVFDPFFTTKDAGRGTGLGLSIAYGIISEHHGTIGVESEVGVGSTFAIRLPAAPAAHSELVA